jgi:nucleic acid-binding protein yitL
MLIALSKNNLNTKKQSIINTFIMNQIKLGDYNTLKMVKIAERPNPHSFGGKEIFGIYLDGGKEGDILMPQKYVPQGVKIGDDVSCFIYLDQDERPIATTETPFAKVGEFAYLECTWVNEYGAFLNWGLMKDIFCPFREQKRKMEIGERYIVYIYIDEESYRIVASAKVEHFLTDVLTIKNKDSEETDDNKIETGAELPILIWQKSPLGFKVIIDNKYQGLIYQDQIFRLVHTGDQLQGYIQNIRPDGKIDVSLQPVGRRQTEDFAETLLQYLKDNNGICELGDKSEADAIYRQFHVSKKVYKRAVGDLYKRRLIMVESTRIKLL